MNNTLFIILLMVGGALLIYSAVKNKDPRDVLKESLKRR